MAGNVSVDNDQGIKKQIIIGFKVGVLLLVIEVVVALGIMIVFYTFNNRESIVTKNGGYNGRGKAEFFFYQLDELL